ncbi:HYR domain-containing protein [Draconibacterium sp. IB214405]|uniref:HYR domain-containing protein n=1 Tax=Draconibacterium sp. IB214405 TaxID=3097352 RepID=UPI002A0ADF17|nr:HYR domain-containing protein [Draconibacterium sp. IB214405]MDX8340414.1 HYR domain-containing protein [Draconibacterium sp. IB214405]
MIQQNIKCPSFLRYLNLKAGLRFLFISGLILFGFSETKGQNCTVNAGTNGDFCINETATLDGAAAGLFVNPDSTASWSQVSGPSVAIVDPYDLQTKIIGLVGGQTYVFRLSATCEDGTLVSQDVTYLADPITIADAGEDQTYCPGNYVLSANEPGEDEYGRWSFADESYGITFTTQSISEKISGDPSAGITVDGSSCGAVGLVWTIFGANGCISRDTVVITNRGGDLPVSAGSDIVLDNCYSTTQSTNLNASSGGCGIDGQQGTWTVLDGPNSPTIANSNSNTSRISNLVEGTYTLRWTVEGPCASGSDEVTITVPAPTADVTDAQGGSAVYCDGRTEIILDANQPLYANETAMWTLVSPDDPNVVIENADNYIALAKNLDGVSDYVFRYTITNPITGCVSSADVHISYAESPSVNIIPSTIIMQLGQVSDSIPFEETGTGETTWSIVSGPVGGLISSPNGIKTLESVPTEEYSFDSSPLVLGFETAGTYIVRIRKFAAFGGDCETALDEVAVVVSREAENSNAGTDQYLACDVTNTSLSGNDPGDGTGLWSQVSGPNTANITSPHTRITPISDLISGTYEFKWNIINGPLSVPHEQIVKIVVADTIPSQADAGPDQVVCQQTPVYLDGNEPILNEWGNWEVIPDESWIVFSDKSDPNTKVTGLLPNSTYLFVWSHENACGITYDTCVVEVTGTVGPVEADAGADACYTSGTNSFNLAGSDPGSGTGTWTQVNGSGANITTPSSPTTTVTVTADGTYYFEWSVSSGVGCNPSVDTVMITIAAETSQADAGPDQQICGDTIYMSAASPTIGTGEWIQLYGAGGVVIEDITSPTTMMYGLVEGTYWFIWEVSNNACDVTRDTVVVNVSERAETPDAGPDQVICAANSTTLDANYISNGLWTIVTGPTNPVFSSHTDPKAELSNLVMGRYVLTWAGLGGAYCPIKTDTLILYVVPLADAGPDQEHCNTITAVELAGNDASKGTWEEVTDFGAVITATSANFATASNLVLTETYLFSYTIDTAGCTTSDTMAVTLYPPPDIADAGPDQVLCGAGSFDLSALDYDGSNGTGQWTVLYSPGGGTFSPDASSPDVTFTPDPGSEYGIFVFGWEIANGTCSNTDQIRVENYEPPSQADAGNPQLITCEPFTTLGADTTDMVGVGHWYYLSGTGATEPVIESPLDPHTTVSNLSPTAAGTVANYRFVWTVSNGPLCPSSSDTVFILVENQPSVADAGEDQELCEQSTINMNAIVPEIGDGAWTFIDEGQEVQPIIDFPDSATTSVSNLTPGVFRFVWQTSKSFCTSEDTVTITNYAEPSDPYAGEDFDYCQFDVVVLAATPPEVGTGVWSQVSGPTNAILLTPNNPETVVAGTVVTDDSTSYVFVYTVSNETCPSKSDSVIVKIFDAPVQANAGPDIGVCNADSVQLNANTPAVFSSPDTVVHGVWSVEPANSISFDDSTDHETIVRGLVPGNTYTLTWTLYSNQCTSTDEMVITVYDDVTIIGPESEDLCVGGNAALSVSVSGGTGAYFYQWQVDTLSASGGWSDISGATSRTYTTPSYDTPGEYAYRVIVTDCGTAISDSAVITIFDDPSIITQPEGDTLCYGDTHTMSVLADGGADLTYRWQTSTTGTGNWSDISGATGASYTTESITQITYYRVVIEDHNTGCDNVTSEVVAVYIPTIETQPLDEILCEGGTANLFLEMSADGAYSYSYQWQISTDNTNWNDIVDSTSTTLTTDVLPIGVYYYRCEITSDSPVTCTLTSNAVAVEVVADPIIDSESGDADICVGGTVTNSVSVSGGVSGSSFNYQWQVSTIDCNSGFSNIGGATSATYTTSALTIPLTYYFRCIITQDEPGCEVISACKTVVVHPDPVISPHPESVSVCSGDSHTMSLGVSEGVGDYGYQWRSRPQGTSTWNTIEGATDSIYTATNITENTEFQVIVTDGVGCDVIASNLATVYVPSITVQPIGADVCDGGEHTMTVEVDTQLAMTYDYQWEHALDPSGPWSSVDVEITDGTGFDTDSFTSAPLLTSLHYFRCVVTPTDPACSPIYTDTVLVNAATDPVDTTAAILKEICDGTNETFTVEVDAGVDGSSYIYQWQDSIAGGSWADVSGGTGADSASYTTANINITTPGKTDTIFYRCLITQAESGCLDVSEPDTLLIHPQPEIVALSADTTICAGTTATLNVEAQFGLGDYQYQWQKDTTGTGDWVNITGATDSTYITDALYSKTYFRVLINDEGKNCNDLVSETITVSVPEILVHPQDNEVCEGAEDVLSVVVDAGSATISYQWQFSDFDCESGWQDIVGATDSTYVDNVLPAEGQTRYFRCLVSVNDPACTELYSECAAITIIDCDAVIGIANQLVSLVSNGDGSYDALFNIRVENLGSGNLNNIQVVNNLVDSFGVGNYSVEEIFSTSFAVDTTFNGDTNQNMLMPLGNSLVSGASTNIELTITIYSGGTYWMSCTASGERADGNLVTDISDNGSQTDTNLNGDPTEEDENDPTPIYVDDQADLVTVKTLSDLTYSYLDYTQVSVRIQDGGDDVLESDGGDVLISTTSLELVNDDSLQLVALRFSDLNIPQGAIIENAYIQFHANATNSETTNYTIVGHASDDSPTFLSSLFNVSLRSATTSSVSWEPPSWIAGEEGLDQQTPDLTSIIQEIVNRAGFSESSAITFMISGVGANARAAVSYEQDPSKAPLLRIGYSESVAQPDTLVNEGDLVFFNVKVSNNGPSVATNVELNDIIPDGLAVEEATTYGDGTFNSGTGVWSIGTLSPGESVNLGIDALVEEGTSGSQLTNLVTAAVSDMPDTTSVGDTLSASVYVQDYTNLVISKNILGSNELSEGATDTFLIRVINKGTALATNVSLNDLLPAGLTANGSPVVTQGSYDSGTGLWQIGTLGAESYPSSAVTHAAEIYIPIKVDVGTAGDTITNVISNVSLDQQDTTTAGDDLEESIVVVLSLLAENDVNTTLENIPVTGQVFTNDIIGENVTVSGPFNGPLNGSIAFVADGSYTYSPNEAFTGEDSFDYVICDNNGICDTATVVIEVIPAFADENRSPVAVNDNSTAKINSPVNGQLLSNDFDPDGDNITINTTPVSGPASGSLTINADGTYTFTPAVDFVGPVSFEYEICDNGSPSLCDTALVTIQILNTSSATNTTVAVDDAYMIDCGESVSDNVSVNDYDQEGDSQNNFTLLSTVANGTLSFNADGSFSYTPDVGFEGNDQFIYQVCDDGSPSACHPATVYILVEIPKPDAVCLNISIPLDLTGSAYIEPEDLDGGSSSSCSSLSFSVDINSFSCDDIGDNTVQLTVTDEYGKSDTCFAIVTILDSISPVLVCPPTQIGYADENCETTVPDFGTVIAGIGCSDGIIITQSPLADAVVPLGDTTITIIATDTLGNADTCTTIYSVVDTIAPEFTCPGMQTLYLDTNCQAEVPNLADSITDALDNCGPVSITQSTPAGTLISNNLPVIVTVSDPSGNSSQCIVILQLVDTTSPTAVCTDITLPLDITGRASISTADVDGGSTDNCSPVSLSIDKSEFNCDNIGANAVTLTVTDESGNVSTCVATVTVVDSIAPALDCPESQIAYADLNCEGTVPDFGAQILEIGCLDGITITQTPTAGEVVLLGETTITIVATDAQGNTDSCTTLFTVIDTTPPTFTCPPTQTVYADVNCQGAVPDLLALVTDATDNCEVTLAQSISAGTLINNDIPVEITATDASGNETSCTVLIQVEDTISPTAVCQNIERPLDMTGSVYITAADVDGGSTDNCSAVNLSLDITEFSCDDIGDNIVILTVTDQSGNQSTCQATVTITDSIAPALDCPESQIGYADTNCEGTVPDFVATISGGGCTDGITITQTPTAGEVVPLGETTITIVATDAEGNSDSCTTLFTVIDTTPPTFTCPPTQTVYADVNCQGAVPDLLALVTDATDNCEVTLEQSISAGTLINNDIPVEITAIDASGNETSCTVLIQLEDTISPTAVCQNIERPLDMTGSVYITAADVDGGSTDNCSAVNLSLDITEFTCDDIGDNTVTLTVTDQSGNQSTCQATVTITDSIAPALDCPESQVGYADTNCEGTVPDFAASISGGGCTDGITITQTPAAGATVALGENAITIIATDAEGNSDTCTTLFTVIDTTPPTFTCPPTQTVYADVNCQGAVPDLLSLISDADDNCEVTLAQSISAGTLINNDIPVEITATDASGNATSCSVLIQIEDTISPTAVCQNIERPLDMTGSVYITAADVDGGSTDNCSSVSLSLDITEFTCDDIGDNIVILTVTDQSGNQSTCQATVTITDSIAPALDCPESQVGYADTNCEGTVPDFAATISGGGCTDGITITQTPAAGVIVPLGETTITIVATDAQGNTDSCTTLFTVIDTTPPTFICPPTQTVYADVNCQSEVPDLLALVTDATDNCEVTLAQSIVAGTLINSDIPVEITATDASGNETSCTVLIQVEDTISPTAVCQNIERPLDMTGSVYITAADVDGGSTDNCSSVSLSLDITEFNCDNIGDNTVTLTVTDQSGNQSSCQATVTITDSIAPALDCPESQIGYADTNCEGTVPDFAATISGGGCTDGITITQTPAAGATVALGENEITIIATDAEGNSDTCTTLFTVIDTTPPTFTCPPTQTVYADANCQGAVPNLLSLISDADDNCEVTLAQSISAGTLINNDIPVEIKATDASGNETSCLVLIQVEDTISPTAVCQNIERPLDMTGSVYITAADVDGGSTDNCSPVSLSLDITEFTCDDIGDNIVTLTVTDQSGNQSTCQATVTITDSIAPALDCPESQVGYADTNCEGTVPDFAATISGGGCTDGITITQTPVAGEIVPLGETTITIVATDAQGNTDSCTTLFTVIDTTPPTFTCPPTQTVYADVNCQGTVPDLLALITDATDNCEVTLAQSISAGTLINNDIPVEITATDASGNETSCTVLIQVEDTISPTAVCQNIERPLDMTGSVYITAADVDGGSTDNCSAVSLSLDITEFTCDDIGDNIVTLTVTDQSGNQSTCQATVTITDSIAPALDCPESQVGYADTNCEGTVPDFAATISGGGCTDGITISQTPVAGTVVPLGETTITIVATDAQGNSDSCTTLLTVIDTTPPTFTCPPTQTVYADVNCQGEVPDLLALVTDATDNCEVTLAQSISAGTLINNDIPVEITATDASGNETSCSVLIQVEDTISPTAVCTNIERPLDMTGSVYITAADVDGGSTDNCSAVSLSLDITEFTCDDIGDNIVILTVTDQSGNQSTCQATVTITDSIAPALDCPESKVGYADTNCEGTVPDFAATISGGGCTDGISITQEPVAGTFVPLGETTITIVATDAQGNTDSCTTLFTVIDTTPPTFTCPPTQTVAADENCEGTVPDLITLITDAADNCQVSLSQNIPAGTIISNDIVVDIKAVDGSGNETECSVLIQIEYEGRPTVDAGENANICTSDGSYLLNGVVTNSDSVVWISSGSGNFSDSTALNATYTPSEADWMDGQIQLTLTAYGKGRCGEASDQMVLTLWQEPSVYAGRDVSIGPDETYQILDAELENAQDFTWELIGGGALRDTSTLTPLFDPDPGQLGTVTVVLTAIPYGSCPQVTDSMTIAISEDPGLTFEKRVVQATVNNDGSYTILFEFSLENTGNVILSNLSITDDLETVFVSACDYSITGMTSANLNLNFDFDGNTDTEILNTGNTLEVGIKKSVVMTVRLENCDPTITEYTNTAIGRGDSPGGDILSGSDSADILLKDNPNIGLAKQLVSINQETSGHFVAHFDLRVKNYGDVELTNIIVTDDLDAAFGAGNYEVYEIYSELFTVNTAFDGSADINLLADDNTLQVGETGSIDLRVTILSGGYYENTATVTGNDPAGNNLTDTSHDGADPAPGGGNNPDAFSDPTIISINTHPNIGLAKQLVSIEELSDGSFSALFNFRIKNYGDVDLIDLKLNDNLDAAFGAGNYEVNEIYSEILAVNTSFNGSSDVNLLAENNSLGALQSGSVILRITIFSAGNYTNTAMVTATDPLGNGLSDTSQDGSDPAPGGENNPEDFGDPTIIQISDCTLEVSCPSAGTYTFESTPGLCGYKVAGTSLDAVVGGDCSNVTLSHDFYDWGNPVSLDGAIFPVGTTVVTWTATQPNGKSETCSVTITVIDSEAPEFVNCPSGVTFTVGLPSGACEGGAIWNIPVATDNCSDVTVAQTAGPEQGSILTAGIYTIEFTATDASGNTSTCSFNVFVTDTEEPIIVCQPDIIRATDEGSCSWTSIPGSLSPLLARSNCDAAIVWEVTNPDGTTETGSDDVSGYVFDAGTSKVKYVIAETTSGQTWECSFNVTIVDENPPMIECSPDLTLTSDAENCQADVELIPPTVSDNCGSAEYSVSYRVYNPNNSTSALIQGTELNYSFAIGYSRVEWIITDGAGNSVFCFQNVLVSASDSSMHVNAGIDAELCGGTTYSTTGAEAPDYATLKWTTNGSGSFSNPAELFTSYTPSTADELNGSVVLTLTASTDCAETSDEVALLFGSPPEADAGPNIATCYGVPIQIEGATAQNYSSVLWTTDGAGELINEQTLTPSYYPADNEDGTIELIMLVVGDGACSGDTIHDLVHLQIYPELLVETGPDDTIFIGNQTELTVKVSNGSGNYFYSWDPAVFVTDDKAATTLTQPLDVTTVFEVLVTDAETQCTATDEITIYVEEDNDKLIGFYNAFSPNGDGVNDTWAIRGIEEFPRNEVMIFNMWGDKLREFQNYDNVNVFWDGTNKNEKLLPDGTYYFVITLTGVKSYAGWVHIKGGN